jgi:hypothetical protein
VREESAGLKSEISANRDDRPFDMFSHMKRTTLVLDAILYAELKRLAASEGRTLTEIVERALRGGLHAAESARRRRPALPSYDLGPFLSEPGERA